MDQNGHPDGESFHRKFIATKMADSFPFGQIEDLKVTLGQNMKVKVNHKRVSLPFVSLGVLSIVQEGYSVVVRTNIGK